MASLLYRSLKIYCTAGLKFFFRKWEIAGAGKIPACSVIFVPNHQNAFLDAILVTCSSEKNPWYLTRANVFEKPRAAKMLILIQMLPVYRFRDGYATLKKNEQVMENMVQQINNGESILIFSEGTHNERNNLAPLQKGVARIALATDKNKKIAIVPVGLTYESRTRFRSGVLVNFGNPIFVNHSELAKLNPVEQIETLMTSIRNELEPLLLHINSEGYEERWNYLLKHRQYKSTLKDQLESDQQILKNFPASQGFTQTTKSNDLFSAIAKSYAIVNNFIFLFITRNLILPKIKDPQFIGSIKYASGLFLAPLFWLLQSIAILWITGSIPVAVIYFISLPVSLKLSK